MICHAGRRRRPEIRTSTGRQRRGTTSCTGPPRGSGTAYWIWPVELDEEVRTTRLVHEMVDVTACGSGSTDRCVTRMALRPRLIVLVAASRSVRLPREYDRGSVGVDGAIHHWSSRKATCFRHSSSSPYDKRFIGRDRGMGCSPVSMRNLKASPRSRVRPGGRGCKHVRVFAS